MCCGLLVGQSGITRGARPSPLSSKSYSFVNTADPYATWSEVVLLHSVALRNIEFLIKILCISSLHVKFWYKRKERNKAFLQKWKRLMNQKSRQTDLLNFMKLIQSNTFSPFAFSLTCICVHIFIPFSDLSHIQWMSSPLNTFAHFQQRVDASFRPIFPCSHCFTPNLIIIS